MSVNCSVINDHTLNCSGTIYEVAEGPVTPDEPEFWIYIGIYVALMLFAGLVAGLTLGLLSLDITTLQVLSTAGTPSEQKYAARILPLVKNSHLLLVTLILANAAAAESMPLFLDQVTSPIVAVAVSVTAVLINFIVYTKGEGVVYVIMNETNSTSTPVSELGFDGAVVNTTNITVSDGGFGDHVVNTTNITMSDVGFDHAFLNATNITMSDGGFDHAFLNATNITMSVGGFDHAFLNATNITVNENEFDKAVYNTTLRCISAVEGRLYPEESSYWVSIVLYALLTCCSGLYSGLTGSYFSLDLTKLKVIARQGVKGDQDRIYASRVITLLTWPYLVLVTLNLGNVAAIVALPIILSFVASPGFSIVVSAFAVLIFNKLLPQVLADKHGLAFAGCMAWFVYFSIALFFVVAGPIAAILSLCVGRRKEQYFERSELKALIELQMTSPDAVAEKKNLTADEVLIITGALDAESMVARDAMIPLTEVWMLDYHGVLDEDTMLRIASQTFSHVPVYKGSRQNIEGEFVVKSLITLNPDDRRPISSALAQYGRSLSSVLSSTPIYDILDEMNAGRYRIAAVCDDHTGTVVGVLTLQNVLDVILGNPFSHRRGSLSRITMGKMKLNRSRRSSASTKLQAIEKTPLL